MNAVQGAKHAGATRIITVDPVEFKREAAEQFGATDTVSNIAEAAESARSITNGQGAASVILCVGLLTGDHIGEAFESLRKDGTMVVTAVAKPTDLSMPVSPFLLAMYQKRVQGALFGMMSPTKDIPRLLDMYRAGQLKLDELVTRTYTLDQINQGYYDMHAGRNLRGAIVHEH